jgi:hypothetical protein
MKFWDRMGALFTALAFTLAAGAQTTPATTTCTTAPTGISTFNIERTVPLSNVLTTLTPNAPANVLASIAAGAQEIREQLIYNPGLGTVTVTTFLVDPGSPTPTPVNNISPQNTLQTITVQISQILTSCAPTPSVLLVGRVTNSPASGVYGSLVGAPAAISAGYTTDTPAKINNVAVVIAGQVLDYSTAGTGSLTFPAVTVVPPGSTGAVSVKVLFGNGTFAQPNTTFQVPSSPFLLDATGSTGNGALTYSFTTAAGSSPVAFVQTGTPGKVNVQFPGAGGYVITVTVTDSAGNSSSLTFTLTYTGRPQ